MVAVLGSILAGIASPTEAAAVGAMGATVLTAVQKRLKWNVLTTVMRETAHLSAMVFFILLGATTFTLVFRTLGGDDYLVHMISQANLSPHMFLLVVMLYTFRGGIFYRFY